MVYDERQNYVGDKHWGGSTLEEGEELELERGILVEVGEPCGRTEQSMEEVLDKVTARRGRNAETPAPSRGIMATPASAAGRFATPAPPSASRHIPAMSGGGSKPLSALLGTPSGHHGRALLPLTSPFEDRQNEMRQASLETPQPASKRRKLESSSVQGGYAQKLTGATLHLGAPAASTSATSSRGSLFARPPKPQQGSMDEDLRPVAKEISYPTSIAPKPKTRKAYEKPSKPGYAQKLTGAVLDLSSTQKTNAFLGRSRSAVRQESPDIDEILSRGLNGNRAAAASKPKPTVIAAVPKKRASQISDEEEQLLARLAELRAAREAKEAEENMDVEDESMPLEEPANNLSLLSAVDLAEDLNMPVDDDDGFMDIDTVLPSRPSEPVAKPKPKARAPRKKPVQEPEKSMSSLSVANEPDIGDIVPAQAIKKPARQRKEKSVAQPRISKATPKSLKSAETTKDGSAPIPVNSNQSISVPEVAMSDPVSKRQNSNVSEATSQTSNSTDSAGRKKLRIKSKPKRNMLMLSTRPPPPVRVPVSVVTESEPPEPTQGTKDVLEQLEQRKKRAALRRAEKEPQEAPAEVMGPVVVEILSSPEPSPQRRSGMQRFSPQPNVPTFSAQPVAIRDASQEADDVYDFEDDILMLESPVKGPPIAQISRVASPLPDAESEEAGISYTDIDNLLERRPPAANETLRVKPAEHSNSDPSRIVPKARVSHSPPLPSLPPMSSMAFEDHTQRERIPVTIFAVPKIPSRANSSFGQFLEDERRVPATPSTQHATQKSSPHAVEQSAEALEVEVQVVSSQAEDRVARGAMRENISGKGQRLSEDELDETMFDLTATQIVKSLPPTQQAVPSPQLIDSSPPIVAPTRRLLRGRKSPSPAPSPSLRSPSPPPKRARTSRSKAKAKSPPSEPSSSSEVEVRPRSRELSLANEEKLAAGRSVLVKLKSHIRSREIIRPPDPFKDPPQFNSGLLGRAPQPIIHHYRPPPSEDEEEEEDEPVKQPARKRKAPVKPKAEPKAKPKPRARQTKKVIESEDEEVEILQVRPKGRQQARKIIESEDEIGSAGSASPRQDEPTAAPATNSRKIQVHVLHETARPDESVAVVMPSPELVATVPGAAEEAAVNKPLPSLQVTPTLIESHVPLNGVGSAKKVSPVHSPGNAAIQQQTVAIANNPTPKPLAEQQQQTSEPRSGTSQQSRLLKKAVSASNVDTDESPAGHSAPDSAPASAPATIQELVAETAQQLLPVAQPEKRSLPAPKPAAKLPQTILEAAAKKKADRSRIAGIFAPSRIMPTATQEERIEGDLVLAMPVLPGFKKPKSVPIVPLPKKVTSGGFEKSVREQQEDEKIGTQIEEMGKGKLGGWQDGAWTTEAFDLFDWRPASELLKGADGAAKN